MKVQLLTTLFVLVFVTAHCKQVRFTNGKLRSNRSPVNDGQFNEYGQPLGQDNGFVQDPQFSAQPAGNEYGFISNQEAPLYNDGNVPQGPLDQNIPIVTEQTVQDNVAELPTQDNHQPDSDEEDDEDVAGGKIDKNSGPSFNFFPVTFGSGKGRSGGFPAGTVAIANSFSTGRRGVATSNANAFADPAALRRN